MSGQEFRFMGLQTARRLAFALALLAVCGAIGQGQRKAANAPTFAQHIAPILRQKCAACHREGGAAPFALTTYRDAQNRARQIAQVTRSRYMPPWKPAPMGAAFLDDCHLTAAQITLFQRWAETGAKEGSFAVAAQPPVTPPHWRLGTPDLTLKLPQPYTLTGDTAEVFRCFVLPTDLPEDRWLRAVEIRPGNPRILRHATLYIDTTGAARKRQQLSRAVGYADFAGGVGASSSGSVADWTPGVSPHALPMGTAIRLPARADLVLVLRFHPSGREETEQTEIGLYFAARPPAVSPVAIPLGARELYLEPGKKAVLTDAFTLPVAVRLLQIVPNAHYIATRCQVTAVLPTGTQKTLLQINDWDMNWKRPYRLATPCLLPAQTRLLLRYAFDNTPENPRNPHNPPHHVGPGLDCLEEMANVWLQAIPLRPADSARLEQAVAQSPHSPQITESGTYLR